MIEKQTGKGIKRLRTDNSLEFCFDEFNAFCKEEDIVRHHTVVGTPHQNGVAEGMKRTIMEKVHCMLSSSKFPKSLWDELALTNCFLINWSPSLGIDKQTPIEVWLSNLVTYFDLKIIGCPTNAYFDNRKLKPSSTKCVFLGYKSGVKGYKLWCPEIHKTIISRDVVFDEFFMISNLSINDSCDTSQQKSGIQVELHIRTKPVLESTPQHLVDKHHGASSSYSLPLPSTRVQHNQRQSEKVDCSTQEVC